MLSQAGQKRTDHDEPVYRNLAQVDLSEVVRDTLRVFAQNANFHDVEVVFEVIEEDWPAGS